MASSEPTENLAGGIKGRTSAQDAVRRLVSSKSSMFGLVVFAVVILVAVFAPWLTHYNPNTQFRNGLKLDGSPIGPSSRFWLGTDALGRDLFSRLVYGLALRWRLRCWRTSSLLSSVSPSGRWLGSSEV